ncbi:pentapeptide repeat-containing protein [Trichothermofontia sp.]
MASPSVRSRVAPTKRSGRRLRPRALPVSWRRLSAWTIEVSLIVASSAIPWSLGQQVNHAFKGTPVPLNPVLVATQETIAQTLAIPRRQPDRLVAPLANLLWSSALLLPLLVAGWQIHALGKTGQTPAKGWLGLQVVDAAGMPPGLARSLVRELGGRWGIPVGMAYLVWRYTGAFPDLRLLIILVGALITAAGSVALGDRHRRTVHDRLAGTYVLGTRSGQPRRQATPTQTGWQWQYTVPGYPTMTVDTVDPGTTTADWRDLQEQAAITSIILAPEIPHRQGLWAWMRQHPGLTLLIVLLSSLTTVLGTVVGTQFYIQEQTNQRELQNQGNEVFLTLVRLLSPNSEAGTDERQEAILALGALNAGGHVREPRAIPLLVDLLSQETQVPLMETLHQALVSTGPPALPYLHRLNRTLRNDLSSLQFAAAQDAQALALTRLQATQRAIAKILVLYSSKIHNLDLSQVNLSQTASPTAQFTLNLDKVDLAGIQLRGASLVGASLRGSRFYGAGNDGRWGTFDDWVTDLSGADLKEANLEGAFLSHTLLKRSNLMRSHLQKADLTKAQMTGANLSSANLSRANLERAILTQASFTGADLGNANLAQANLQSAQMSQVKALGAQFPLADLTASDWQGADLSGANLQRANLQQANLSAARLAGADLQGTQLQFARLHHADLSLADLRGANLENADFYRVVFTQPTTATSSEFIRPASDASLSTIVQGVNFAKVRNLNQTQIDYICQHGGIHPQCWAPTSQ